MRFTNLLYIVHSGTTFSFFIRIGVVGPVSCCLGNNFPAPQFIHINNTLALTVLADFFS